jgi:Na+-translocating ferredoxin:NAD+ oxidoreductase RnfD subunit
MKATTTTWERRRRLGGLRRFAVAITILNVLGHTVFGFEQSWAQPFVAVAAAYATELALEIADAAARRRRPSFMGGGSSFVDFLLSAHISGLAVSMLLYTNERLWPTVFASIVAIASKAIFRVPVDGASRHVFNPSNLGISVTLLLFPWVGIAPPYHFTENLSGLGDWILPAVIIGSGSLLNARFTGRLPLIAGWLAGFAAQAVFRSVAGETPLAAALLPMTGVTFLLYTFYMVTDPATTPDDPRAQVAFGLAVAAAYSLLVTSHIVFQMFFGLSIVCALRAVALSVVAWTSSRAPARIEVGAAPTVGKVEP